MEFIIANSKYVISPIVLAAMFTVIGAIIAALIAFRGVRLSNQNSREQLRMQLAHDADQKALDRQMAMRRDVYLEVAAWATDVAGVVGNLTTFALDNESMASGLKAHAAGPARLQIVASNETIKLALRVQEELVVIMTEAMPSRFAVLNVYNEMLSAKSRMEELQASGAGQEAMLSAADEVMNFASQFQAMQPPFAERAYEQLATIISTLGELNVSIRQELGFKIDADVYLAHLKENSQLARKRIGAMVAGMLAEAEQVKETAEQ